MYLDYKRYSLMLGVRKIKAMAQSVIGIQEYEHPFISTYEYNFTPYNDEDVIIPFYVTDYYQKEWLLDDTSLTFDVDYGVYGKPNTNRVSVPAGDHTINLGKLPIGEYRITIQATDRGVKSHKLYIPILVKDRNSIVNMYTMTEDDLATYAINNHNSEDATDLANTRKGLIHLIKDKKEAGYNGITLLKGYYRIDKDSTADNKDVSADDVYITVPTNFTLNLNGSTIKHHVFVGQNTCIIRYADGCIDSHITNGTIIGDYGEHSMETNPDTGYTWGEHANSVVLSEGKFCTLNNVTIKDVQGYSICFGSGKNLRFQPFSKGTNGIKLVNGVEVTDDKYSTTGMTQIYTGRISKDDRWLMFGTYGGVNYLKGASWNIKISFFDKDKHFLYDEIGYQYRDTCIPIEAEYVRVTYLGDITGNTEAGIVSLHASICNSILNVASVHTRTCAIAPTCSYFLVKECTFENCATQTTPITIDAEDGWGYMYDMYYIDNEIISNAVGTTGNLLVCYGNNTVLRGNKNFKVIMRRGTQRFYADNHKGSISRDLYPRDSYAFSCYDNIVNSTLDLYADNTDSNTHWKVLKNCNIKVALNSVNPNDILNRCTLAKLPSCKVNNSSFLLSNTFISAGSADCINGFIKVYNSSFYSSDEDNTLRYSVGLRLGHGNDIYFYNCIFNDKCKIFPAGGTLLSMEFSKCTFNDVYIELSPNDAQEGDKVVFKDCNITFSEDALIKYAGNAYAVGHNHLLEFENCHFKCINANCQYLIYLYSYPSGICTFKNCTFEGCKNLNVIDVRHYSMDKFDTYSVVMKGCDTTAIGVIEKDTFANKIKITIENV